MALKQTETCDVGWRALDFNLPATAGERVSLNTVRQPNGFVIMFICNHCPYVVGVVDRIASEGRALLDKGIGVAAICANDADAYPEDSFEAMIGFARQHRFAFPYLHDADQSVAKGYGAVCTPDFFGFNGQGELHYRGRLDDARNKPADTHTRRELYEAMMLISQSGKGPAHQMPSMGCSIKWKP